MKSYVAADIKSLNRRSVYEYIRLKGSYPVSCAEIAKATKISAPTVLKILDFFIEKQLLLRQEQEYVGKKDVGRKPFLLDFNPNAAFAVGINYNGKLMEASLVNLNYMNVLSIERKLQVDLHTCITQSVVSVIQEFSKQADINNGKLLGIGIALPAAVDSNSLEIISQIPDLHLHDTFSLSDSVNMLTNSLSFKVSIENDVNAAAYSDFRMKGLSTADDLAFLYFGSGCGAGIILDGALRRGASHSCGEIGFMIFDRSYTTSRKQYGYFESLLTPEYIQEHFRIDIENLDTKTDASQLIEHIASNISICMANIMAALDITRFTLGGRMLKKFRPNLESRIAYYCDKFCLNPPIISYETGEYIVANGAASLCIDSRLSDFLT